MNLSSSEQEKDHQLDLVFGALSDPTRRAILLQISRKTCSVSELAAPFEMSLPAISKHLKILERAGLLDKEKDGRVYRCDFNGDPLSRVSELIDYYKNFWEKRFESLESFILETDDSARL